MKTYRELPKNKEIIFAIGHIGPGMLSQFISIWLLKYYLSGNINIQPFFISLVLTSGRLVDGLTEPFIANISDNLIGHKWGRRMPMMLIGSLPLVISFILIWVPVSILKGVMVYIWPFIFVNIFYLAYNFVVNPYFALMPELVKTEGNRARVQSYVALFGILGMGFALGGAGFFIEKIDFLYTSIFFGLFCLFVLIGPILITKHLSIKPSYVNQAEEKRQSTIRNLLQTASNKEFIKYQLSFGLFYIGFNMVQGAMALIATILLGLSAGQASTMFIVSVVSALCFIPFFRFYIKKNSALQALRLTILGYAIVALLFPVVTNPNIISFFPLLKGMFLMVLLGFPYAGLMLIPNIFLSGIIDYDYKITGLRREGMFFGVQGLITKTFIAISTLINGFIFQFFGSSVDKHLGLYILAPIASIFAIIGYLLTKKINIISN